MSKKEAICCIVCILLFLFYSLHTWPLLEFWTWLGGEECHSNPLRGRDNGPLFTQSRSEEHFFSSKFNMWNVRIPVWKKTKQKILPVRLCGQKQSAVTTLIVNVLPNINNISLKGMTQILDQRAIEFNIQEILEKLF